MQLSQSWPGLAWPGLAWLGLAWPAWLQEMLRHTAAALGAVENASSGSDSGCLCHGATFG